MAVNIEHTNYKTPHFAKLAAKLRTADRQEAIAMLGTDAAAALYITMYCSREMYVAVHSEEGPLCAFGVCPVSDINFIWFMGTNDLEKHKRELLVKSKVYLDDLLNKYARLENFVDVRNKKSIRWLKWLGFIFDDEVTPVGINGELFYHFYKEGDEANCVQ